MDSLELKTKRLERNLTQEELGEETGLHKNTIYKYETTGEIPASKAKMLENYFNRNPIHNHNTVKKENIEPTKVEAIIANEVYKKIEPFLKTILDKIEDIECFMEALKLKIKIENEIENIESNSKKEIHKEN